jgi:hypothetical protein
MRSDGSRNLTDYLGENIDAESLNECIAQATALSSHTMDWLKRFHASLLI